jgi:hypothetical protein
VVFNVGLGGFPRKVHGVFMVPAGQVRVMCRGLVFSCFVVLGRFPVVSCSEFMMFGCLVMMLRRLS